MKPAFVSLAFLVSFLLDPVQLHGEEGNPHAVLVAGTPHYDPESSLALLAQQLEERHEFRCSLITTQNNPERNPDGIPGLAARSRTVRHGIWSAAARDSRSEEEAYSLQYGTDERRRRSRRPAQRTKLEFLNGLLEILEEADVAVFFLRFLALPEDQFNHILNYLQSGKPVVGFRTTTHAFDYPENHALHSWNDGFGQRVMGSKYFIHGRGTTSVQRVLQTRPELFQGVALPNTAMGTLYLSAIPEDATPLLQGTGEFQRTGLITNRFGSHPIEPQMTDDVAWLWENEWGGRVFATTLGHPKTFLDASWMRFFVNGICWATGDSIPEN